jgi:hypothetical protein
VARSGSWRTWATSTRTSARSDWADQRTFRHDPGRTAVARVWANPNRRQPTESVGRIRWCATHLGHGALVRFPVHGFSSRTRAAPGRELILRPALGAWVQHLVPRCLREGLHRLCRPSAQCHVGRLREVPDPHRARPGLLGLSLNPHLPTCHVTRILLAAAIASRRVGDSVRPTGLSRRPPLSELPVESGRPGSSWHHQLGRRLRSSFGTGRSRRTPGRGYRCTLLMHRIHHFPMTCGLLVV